jgi:L-iditol 2-dehydrogenase
MKAVVIERPNEIHLTEISCPSPGEGQVKVQVAAVGICMTDIDILEGALPEPYVRYPIIPGHEWCGSIAELGPGVTGLKVGDRVAIEGYNYCQTCFWCRRGETQLCTHYNQVGFNMPGGYADYVVTRADLAHRFADNVPFEAAAITEPAACAGHGMLRANVKPGDTVAVIGPGTVGLLGILWAKLLGASDLMVIGLDRANETLARALGATHYYTLEENPLAQVRQLTEGRGADVVFEAAGNTKAVDLALNLVRRGGAVSLAGVSGSGHFLPVESDIFLLRDLRVHGIFAYSSNIFLQTLRLIESGQLNVLPLITHTFPLENYAAAFDLLRSRREPMIKILLKP